MIYGTDMGGFASGFVHKRLLRGAAGFLAGGPAGAAAGFLTGGGGKARQVPVRRPSPRSETARPSARSAAEKEAGRFAKLNGGTTVPGKIGCSIGFVQDQFGNCVRRPGLGLRIGDFTPLDPLKLGGGAPIAAHGAGVSFPTEAVMGRFGAAYMPGSRIIDRAICLPGDVVATDGLCYPRSKLRNADRAWPRGRRPLLTGGEMRAISTAARAGRRLELASKRLQKIGLMKKPAPRRKLLTSGPTVHHHHDSEH